MKYDRLRRTVAVAMAAVSCVVALGTAGASAADDTIKHVDQHFSGDRVIGHVTMRFVGVNPLTQTVQYDVATTVVNPSPAPGITNNAPATTGAPKAAQASKAAPQPSKQNSKSQNRTLQLLEETFSPNALPKQLHCDKDEEVVTDVQFFEDCATKASQNALQVIAPAEDSLAQAETAVATFRSASDNVVNQSAAVNDDSTLVTYRTSVAGVITATSKDNVDKAVRMVGAWPSDAADTARLPVARYKSLTDRVKDLGVTRKTALTNLLDGATSHLDAKAASDYGDRRKAVIDARDRILALSSASYVQEVGASCSGLFGKGLERKITVKVTPVGSTDPTITDDVTTICPTRSFVSTGFTFASGGDRTFGTVAPNAAAAPVPTGTTASNVIVETTRSDVHAASISFVNFHVAGNPRSEDGMYASFGVIVGTGSNSSADFAAGVSYAFARSFVLTAGGFLGSQTQLAPGYTLGGVIPANVTTPPSTTTRKVKPFVGISFNL